MEIKAYTRSKLGAKFTLTDADHSHDPWVNLLEVKHTGGESLDDLPSVQSITPAKKISGPANIKVKADSNAGRFSTQNFMIFFSVYRKE